MGSTRQFLDSRGFRDFEAAQLPTSEKRFPDGAQYRVEIPSVEDPDALEAVFKEADARNVLVHRVSQGSGGLLTTDDEMHRYAQIGRDRSAEISVFARPTAAWGTGAGHLAPTGASSASQARGTEQLYAALDEIDRIASFGIRSVLVTDIGVLATAQAMRAEGALPADLRIKVSVQMGFANPASIAIAEAHGADTYNIPTDLTLSQIAAIRQAVDIPLDIYVESPDDLGGFMRHYEIGEIVRIAAPVYIKFGLRNSPFIYPSGTHLSDTVSALARERVRRAQIGLDMLRRQYPDAVMSEAGAAGLAVPGIATA